MDGLLEKKEYKDIVFAWAADHGFTPVESEINDLLWRLEKIVSSETPLTAPNTVNQTGAEDALDKIDMFVPPSLQNAADLKPSYQELKRIIRASLTAPNPQPEETPVYYCENGESLEGLEKGALAVLSNLMMKTNADKAP